MEHVDIIDSQRHEPKGASSAIAGQVLKSEGGGKTSFGSVQFSELVGTPDIASIGVAVEDLVLEDDVKTEDALKLIVAKINELLASLRDAGSIGL